MDTISAFGFEACCAAIVGDMARTLAERNGEAPEQQFARAQAAVHMIMGLLPRDVIEALLASHCVMFHELMVDSAHVTLCAREAKARRPEVHTLIALNKAFCGNLDHLRHYQKRPAEGNREAQAGIDEAPASVAAAREPAVPVETTQALASTDPDQMAAVQPPPVAPAGSAPAVSGLDAPAAVNRPTAAAVAAGSVNPAAAATAIQAGDAAGFARALGIEQPSPAFLAAANAAGSPFDPNASGPWPENFCLGKPKT
jgi:hypothetical protein